MCVVKRKWRLCVLFEVFEDIYSHVIDSRVVKYNDTAVGTRLDVDSAVLTEIVVATAEIVTNCLNCGVEFVGYLVHRTVR